MRHYKYPYRNFLCGHLVFRSKKPRSLALGASFLILSIFVLAGCLSVSNSPEARFYALTPVEDSQGIEKYNIPSDVIIGFGPLSIPEYLSRPQIVTMDKDNLLEFSQFDRWGESLDSALNSLISRDLEALLSGTLVESYPWNPAIPVKYQVIVEVTTLEIRMDQEMFLAAQWSLIDVANGKMLSIKKSEFRDPVEPRNYSGIARTLSRQTALLAGQIAQEISSLEVPPPDSGTGNKKNSGGND